MTSKDADDLPVRDLEKGDANNDRLQVPESENEIPFTELQNLSGGNIRIKNLEKGSGSGSDMKMKIADDLGNGSGSSMETRMNVDDSNYGYVNNARQCPTSEIKEIADDPPTFPEWGLENDSHQDSQESASNAHLYLRPPYGRKEKSDYRLKGRPLYDAASNGKFYEAENILTEDPNAVRAYITEGLETSLHISVLANKLEFVTEIVKHMKKKDLEITNVKGNTALCLAAVSGNVDIAQVLIDKHPGLGRICGPGGTLPVMMAAMLGNEEMVEKLLGTEEDDANLLKECISSDLYDIAQKMIEKNRKLAVSHTALEMLATKPMAETGKKEKSETFFGAGMKEADLPKIQALKLLKYMLQLAFEDDDLNIENIVQIAPTLIFGAARRGNFHFFKWLIHYYPELVWRTDESNGVSMFHVAVQHRHESIFALLYEMEPVRKLVTTYVNTVTGDNMLHLAAILAPKEKLNIVTGEAFQMQQAICWYEAVEKIVPPAYKNMPNNNGSTPADIFDQEQKNLFDMGEKWMKATAKSCMLVAALNATVMFASAFTVPGGNDDEGHPYLLNRICFQIFSVSEVIGMLSSSTSILMFLSILTSRVNKYAFQRSLPFKLMIGVAALFVSIVSMVIAFGTTIYLSYDHIWVPGLLLLFASVPILFIFLKFRLLSDIFRSTFVSRFLFQSSNLSNH